MLVNLNKVFSRGENEKQLCAQFDFSGENISFDAVFRQPVHAVLDLKKGRDEISVMLSIKAVAQCSCARCLKLFEKQFDFTQEFVVTPAILTESEPEIPVDSNYTLDVKQLVLQELSLAVPSVLLCREDCPGLCPVCGRPLEENCGCQPRQRTDPRLEILKQLLDNDD